MDLGTVWRIIEIVIGIGILIMIHELGHFMAAKWSGVRVDKFALGMGPKMFAFVRGETEYSIRWLPVGGFVLMAGEEPGSTTEAAPERQFRNQRPLKKGIILFAGSFMNFVLAIVFFTVAFGFGVTFTKPVIGRVEPGSPADTAGLRPGDEIVAVDGDHDVDWEDVHIEILMTSEGESVPLTVLRDGKELPVTVKPRYVKAEGLPSIGVAVACGRTIAELEKGSAAEAAGLKVGDVIETINGRRPIYWPETVVQFSASVGKPMTFVVTRDGREQTFTLTPRPVKRGAIGVMPAHFPAVEAVADNGPAKSAGLKPGDQILAVDNTPTPVISDVVALTGRGTGRPTTFLVRRGSETLTTTITPEVAPGESMGRIGVTLKPADNLTLGAVAPGSIAAAKGFQSGDTLTRIGKISLAGKPWDVVQGLLDLAAEKGGKVRIYRRSGQAEFPPAEIEVQAVADPLRADVGLAVESGEMRMRRYGPLRAPVVGLKKSWQVVEQVYVTLRGMFTHRISPKNAAGPVGIAGFSFAVAKQGYAKFIFWLAFLSANFAVVNLLPMTPFDGGLIVFTIIEKIRGRAVSDKVLMVCQAVGWGLVIVLLIYITTNDISRLVGG